MTLKHQTAVTTIGVRSLRILLSLAGSTVVAGVLEAPLAASPPHPVAPEQGGVKFEFQPTYTASFDYFWARYLAAEQQGDSEQMQRLYGEIRRLRAERNAFNLHDIASAFAYKGAARLARRELEEAENSFRVAREMDPSLPAAYLGLAKVAEQADGVGSFAFVGYSLQGFLASFRSVKNRPYAWADLLWFVFTLFGIASAVFAVLMLYRYGGLLHHDIWERVSAKLGGAGSLALTMGLLLGPLMASFGFGWLVPLWLALSFGYQSTKERVVSLLALILVGTASPLIALHSEWSKTLRNPLYRAAASTVDGTFEPTDPLVIQAELNRHPEDRDLRFLVATHYRLLGEYELAASLYRAILQTQPDDLEARINLGNIYFAQRDWDGAVLEYDRAIDAHPESAVAFYNKSLAHAESFEFRDREASRARAESLDRGLVAAHERRCGEYRAVMELRLGPGDILAKFYGLEEGAHETPVATSWTGGWLSRQGSRLFYGCIVFGGLILLLHYTFDRAYTRQCRQCGMAFCGRCQIGTGRRGLCTQCYHLFIVRDGVSSTAREQKTAQVERFARREKVVFRVLSILAPGGGHIVDGTTLLGVLLLLAWVCGALLWVTGLGFYGLPDELLGLRSALTHQIAVVIMVGCLIVANTVAQPLGRR